MATEKTTSQGLDALKDLTADAVAAEANLEAETSNVPATPTEPVKDSFGRSYATGRRKESVARVWVKPGKGKITVNGKDVTEYFARPAYQIQVSTPLKTVERESAFDVVTTVKGGGLTGQAEAIRHGISRALTMFEPTLRPALKKEGLLTRDSRVVERKKYGQHKARKSTQFSKR